MKQKLLVLGGFLALFVLGGLVYSKLLVKENNFESTMPGIKKTLPAGSLTRKVDEINGFTNKVKEFKEKIDILENDETNPTSKIELGGLQEKFSNTLSEEIKRICQKTTLNLNDYTLVRDESEALIKTISTDENLASSGKNLEKLLNVLYSFYWANENPKKIVAIVDSIFELRKYDEYSSKITKYKKTPYINKNKRVMEMLRSGEDLLSQWKEDSRRYSTFYSNRNHVEIIMTDCKTFNGYYYQTQCEEQRYKSYRHHFTKESRDVVDSTVLVNSNKSNFVLNELDCSKIKNAPPSDKLESMRGHESKTKSFYKDCLKIKKTFKDANEN